MSVATHCVYKSKKHCNINETPQLLTEARILRHKDIEASRQLKTTKK